MKVILLENLKRIGSIGEVIEVKRGFARNFLISNKKALYASKENIKQVEKIKFAQHRYFIPIKSSFVVGIIIITYYIFTLVKLK